MAVTGVGHHDDVRTQLPQVGVVQVPPAHDAGSEVLHHHVADHHQLAEDLPAFLLRHIQHHGPLAAVQQLVGGGTVPPVHARIVVGERTVETAAPRYVRPTGTLDLDHLRPQVSQLPTRVGQREHVGGIQDPDSFQGQCGHVTSTPAWISHTGQDCSPLSCACNWRMRSSAAASAASTSIKSHR